MEFPEKLTEEEKNGSGFQIVLRHMLALPARGQLQDPIPTLWDSDEGKSSQWQDLEQ